MSTTGDTLRPRLEVPDGILLVDYSQRLQFEKRSGLDVGYYSADLAASSVSSLPSPPQAAAVRRTARNPSSSTTGIRILSLRSNSEPGPEMVSHSHFQPRVAGR